MAHLAPPIAQAISQLEKDRISKASTPEQTPPIASTDENPWHQRLGRQSLQATDSFLIVLDSIKQTTTPKRCRDEDTSHHPPHDLFPSPSQDTNDSFERRRKRICTSAPFPLLKTAREAAVRSERSFIHYWARESTWPKEYFTIDKMSHLLVRRKSTASLGRKRSYISVTNSSAGASDERPREEKSAPYRNPSYPCFLSEVVDNYKSYMRDHELGISDHSENLLDSLLNTKQIPPKDTWFRDDIFDKHREKLKGKNETRILQDLSPLLVPSSETFASFGAKHLDAVVESINEGWNNCFPITKTRPQPDSAFGYGRSAFSTHHLNKLKPVLGDPLHLSYFKATYYMLFPFLTKEVKTGTTGLDTADNQNLHSATIAVRAVAELFKLANREKELHREIVAFSISHDDKMTQLYAHYPFFEGDKVTIWRRTVDQYILNPNTKWRAWTFTKNIFDEFSTMHLERIRPVMDDIPPEMTFSRESESQTSEHLLSLGDHNPTPEASGLSQHFQHQRLSEDSEVLDR